MNTTGSKRSIWLIVAAAVAVPFGLLSIFSGGSVLFGPDEAQRSVGAYVGFVLWFNFLAGFAYVIAGVGLWARQRWAVTLAFLIAAATLLVFAAFGVHVANGGAYEVRTLGALIFRSLVWLAIAAVAYRQARGRGAPHALGA